MATKMKEVDVVIVGLGWTGGILAKELTEAGLKVVALERGGMRSTANDYSVPQVRDELVGERHVPGHLRADPQPRLRLGLDRDAEICPRQFGGHLADHDRGMALRDRI